MPLIENIDPSSVKSPIAPLLKHFQSCPFKVAPERQKELETLRDKHNLHLTLDSTNPEFFYCVSNMFCSILVGVATLERLWAYAYAYFVFFELHREVGMGVEVDLRTNEQGKMARGLLIWAMKCELGKDFESWPDGLPHPSTKDDPNVEPANELFLVMNGWILLHELGHLECGHSFKTSLSSEQMIQDEHEADNWASSWILSKWQDHSDDEKVFIKRTLGISFALSAFTGMEYYLDGKVQRTHPPSHLRLIRFLDKWVGQEDTRVAKPREMAWYAATAILSAHLLNSRSTYESKGTHATFREFIVYAGKMIDEK